MRLSFSAVALVFWLSGPVLAGEEALKGNWTLNIYFGAQQVPFWLVRFETNTDGKPSVAVDSLRGGPKAATVKNIKVVGDSFYLTFVALTSAQDGAQRAMIYSFEGKLPSPGDKTIFGSLREGGTTVPTVLEATPAISAFELDRDFVKRSPNDPKAFAVVLDLIKDAKKNKVPDQEVQTWVAGSYKSAERYGSRYRLVHGVNLLEALYAQKGYGSIAIDLAQKVVKQIDPKMAAVTQMTVLAFAAKVLRSRGAKTEADGLDALVEGLEGRAFSEYAKTALNFKVEKFTGRKTTNNRAVLVELFTGAKCPRCVAPDMAFDGLALAYPSRDVVLLQYHLHDPGSDAMANAVSEARNAYYLETYPKQIGAAPTVLFDGKPIVPNGGFKSDAPKLFQAYGDAVNNLLELPATVQLNAQAVRIGDKVTIHAKVNDLAKPGDKIRLRLALVEDWVRLRGDNDVPYHQRVVRAMPGGARGTTLKVKDFEKTAEVDLAELRKELSTFLDNPFTAGPRPMRMRDLRVVAFVQNDNTAEVLNAVDVPVVMKK